MLALIISITVSLLSVFATGNYIGWIWASCAGLLLFLAIQVILNLLLRKKIAAVTNEIQQVIADGQQQLNQKMRQFQNKPQGNMKMMQKILEKEQHGFITSALALTDKLEAYYNWSPLIKKQVASMRMQFNFQLKNYDEVDKLIPAALFMDPLSIGMKMAREYKLEQMDDLEKTYKKGSRKFKGTQAILIYAIYSWALVKRNQVEKAIVVLNEGREKTGSEVLTKNWEALVNGKQKQFSNAAIGDQWYTLYLEEPKQPKPVRQKVRQGRTF